MHLFCHKHAIGNRQFLLLYLCVCHTAYLIRTAQSF